MQAAVLYEPRQPLVIEDLRLDPSRAGADGARGCDMLLLEALYVTIRLVLQDGMVAVVRFSLSRTPSRSIIMNLEVVGLRFKPAGKILQYVANGLALHRGEKCVAESENGLEIATVVLAPHTVDLQAGAA